MDLNLLLLSTVAFILGPATASLGRRFPLFLPVLDGFVLLSVTGLILMEVIPHSMEEVGLWAIPLALLGLLVPSMIEKRYHKMAHSAHHWATWFGVSAILIHSTLDGVALSLGSAGTQAEG